MKELVLRAIENDEGNLRIETTVSGFNGSEIIGILEIRKQDLLDQMCERAEFTRTRIYADGSTGTIDKVTK